MASGTGPSISIGLDPEILERIGDVQKAAQVAGAEIRKMEQQAGRLEGTGRTVDAGFNERMRKFEAIEKRAKEVMARNKASDDELSDANRFYKQEKLFRKVQHWAYSPFMQKLFNGEAVSGVDVVREIASSEKLLRKAGRAFGASMETISKLHPAIMFGVEAYGITTHIIDKIHENKQFKDDLQKEITRGHLGKEMMDTLEFENGSPNSIASYLGLGQEKVKKIQDLASAIHGLSAQEIEGSLNAFNRGTQSENEGPQSFAQARREADWQRMSVEEKAEIFKTDKMLGGAIVELIQGEGNRLKLKTGREIRPDEQKRIETKVVNELVQKKLLNPDAVKALREGVQAKREFEDTKIESKTASEEFREREEKRLYDALQNIHHKRLPACPTD